MHAMRFFRAAMEFGTSIIPSLVKRGRGERWVTRQRFPKFQRPRLTRRVADKSLALNPPLALIERFSDSSSNPESGPNSPPTVNNSQASPTAGGNAAAIQEVSVSTDGENRSILDSSLSILFLSSFLSLSHLSFVGDGEHRLRGSVDQQQSTR